MPTSYGQYCPLALACELLCERWTLLVVSRLVIGIGRFNEIHRSLPKISPTLLSQRLAQLEHAGLVERRVEGRIAAYHPTKACLDLGPIVDALGAWGHRWGRDMVDDDLDPAFVVWSLALGIDAAAMPPGRTVIEFTFSGTPSSLRRFWLVADERGVEMCLKHPGYDVDLWVSTDIRRFVEAWRGFRDLRREIAGERIRVEGPRHLVRALPAWLTLHENAGLPRLREGAERRLAETRHALA